MSDQGQQSNNPYSGAISAGPDDAYPAEEPFIVHTLVRLLGKAKTWQQAKEIGDAISHVQIMASSMKSERDRDQRYANQISAGLQKAGGSM